MAVLNTLERAALFGLSVAIGLVDLAVALVVAAYLGVIPKDKVSAAFEKAARMPYIGPLVNKRAAVKGPAKPAPKVPVKKRR